MVELRLLSGVQAGSDLRVRRFPFRIGRAPGMDLRTEADGLWDHHATLDWRRGGPVTLRSEGGALTSVNGARIEQSDLRNGDEVDCGSLRLRFWLAPTAQTSLRWREALIWGGLASLLAVQALTLLWLLQ